MFGSALRKPRMERRELKKEKREGGGVDSEDGPQVGFNPNPK